MKHVEYALQYRSIARGRWHTDNELFLSYKDARREYDVKSNLEIHVNAWPKHWRIAKRKVDEWEEVK